MKPRMVECNDDFAQAVKERREAMGLKHADVDHIVGWQDAYASKVEGFDRPWGKRPFNMTVNATDLMQALGLRMVILPADDAVELVDGGTTRKIKQIGRQGSVPRKETRVTCTIRRRK